MLLLVSLVSVVIPSERIIASRILPDKLHMRVCKSGDPFDKEALGTVWLKRSRPYLGVRVVEDW